MMPRLKHSPVHSVGRIESALAPVRLSADKRREQLIQIAIDLFSRKGFKGTTTREIAVAAGVTEAIIFRHFETKEQLYTAIIDQKLSSPDAAGWVVEFRRAMDQDDDEAVIRQLITAIISTHKTDPEFERLMLYAALEGNEIALLYMRRVTASILDAFRIYFWRGQEGGRFRSVGPEAALVAIVGMARHYASGKYIHGFDKQEKCVPDERAIQTFTQIAMNGLCFPRQPGSAKNGRTR